MTLLIGDKLVVSMHYTLTDDDGNIIDSSESAEPLTYLHGSHQIVPGLERALEGKSVGHKAEVRVTPDEGYGPRNDDARQKVDRGAFPPEADVQVGLSFQAMDEANDQPLMGRIVEIEGDQVTVDFNHPLAGMTLNFDIEIAAVRDATDEEKDHGHAHGEGCGHDH